MGNEKKPWEIGKSFDHSASIGPLHLALQLGHPTQGAIWLKVNGVVRQSSDLKNMIWSVAEQVSRLSGAFELMCRVPAKMLYADPALVDKMPRLLRPALAGSSQESHQ